MQPAKPDINAMFQPDYTPEQLENLGVYDSLYRGQGPRLASLGEWKPEWISEHDPKGWAQWYKRYSGGRRLPEEDERQIKRWSSFKARHGGPFTKNPTPRRGWALRNWGIDPVKLVAPDQGQATTEMLDEYQRKAMQKYVQGLGKQAAGAPKTLFHGSTHGDIAELQAHQPNMGSAGVYGADNLNWAALYALAKNRRGMAVLGGANPKLLINKANELSPEGYVYEYGADNATPPPDTDPNLGWHMAGNTTPLRTHIVKLVDHMKNIEQFDDKETLKKRWQELNNKQAELLPEVNLQDHQQRISDRVTGDDPRMLVYHGLGSGKSLSALAAAEAAKKIHGGSYGIVVPASLRGNFHKEVKKFTRNSSPEIMSYTGLGMGKNFKEQPDTLIMDEAARLRNPNSAMTQAAMRAARDAKRVMLLTGTPITNAPSDLAPLVSMLHGKNIDPTSFTERYVGYEKVKPGWMGWLRGVKPGVRPYIRNEQELRGLLQGRVDYQPSKTPEGVNVNEEIVRTPLSKEQQKIQQAIRTNIPPGFLWKLDQEFPLSKDELARLNGFLTGMRQVGLSTQPFRADRNPLKAFDQSAKLTTAMKNLRKTLDEDPRKKAIIYSNFIDSGINPYAAALERDKIPYGVFHGSIPTAKRQQALTDYNAGKLRALLLGPAAAEGISTKGTSLIQLLDPHWNEARLQQAKGRGLRFDSHDGLPEELKHVAVQRYLNQSEEPGFFGKKFLGKKRERTADEVLERLTAEKEQFNEKFRNILREVGTPAEKTSAYTFGKLAADVLKMPAPQTYPQAPANTRDIPVYKHPSGATQLGQVQFGDYTPGIDKQTQAPTAAMSTPVTAVPNSPGVDSGPGTLRVNLHGGGARLPEFNQLPAGLPGEFLDDGYGLSNPASKRIDISARGNYLNPTKPVPPNLSSHIAAKTFGRYEEPAGLPDGVTNPSTVISRACNPDGTGCTPDMYAKWLQAEQGLNAGYGKQLAGLKVNKNPDGSLEYPKLNTPKLPPLNLNKVVMTPPGNVALGRMPGVVNSINSNDTFDRPYKANRPAVAAGYPTSAAHEYRLTGGGDATNPNHWTDTGAYTDARQEQIPFVGLSGEAQEFGRHLGLSPELGGGNAMSYLDKIKTINNNPDATYAQKVQSNFARPVGSAAQFGREMFGLTSDAKNQQYQQNKQVLGQQPAWQATYGSGSKF